MTHKTYFILVANFLTQIEGIHCLYFTDNILSSELCNNTMNIEGPLTLSAKNNLSQYNHYCTVQSKNKNNAISVGQEMHKMSTL